jgi:hypothetical protein
MYIETPSVIYHYQTGWLVEHETCPQPAPVEAGSVQVPWATERAQALLAVRDAVWLTVRYFRRVEEATDPSLASAIRLLETELREAWPDYGLWEDQEREHA